MGVDVQRIQVAARTEGLDTLVDPEYKVSFELTGAAGGRTAEQWARAIFEDPPPVMRWFLTAGWRYGLWLRLRPTSEPQAVRGWPVVTSTPTLAILAAESPLLDAHNIVEIVEERIVFSTLVRYRSPLGRAIWAVAGRIHVLTLAPLLRRAAASERSA
jgi:hypothetical protein